MWGTWLGLWGLLGKEQGDSWVGGHGWEGAGLQRGAQASQAAPGCSGLVLLLLPSAVLPGLGVEAMDSFLTGTRGGELAYSVEGLGGAGEAQARPP